MMIEIAGGSDPNDPCDPNINVLQPMIATTMV
jgi:hypothetical protein